MKDGDKVGSSVDPAEQSSWRVTGCNNCPLASWDSSEEERVCGLDRKLVLPTDEDNFLIAAVPTACPLWTGTKHISLEKLGR
jgi:hypothetical protein